MDTAWLCLGEYAGVHSARVFIRYVVARYRREARKRLYRTYVTDSLRLFGTGERLSVRWSDVAYEVETASFEEVLQDVVSRGGLVVV